jgi:hypothetical protein
LEWRAAIGNQNGLIRFDFATIPQQILPASQISGCCSHDQAIGRLASATPIRFNAPAQAWFADINAKWMLGVFTTQINNAQHCGTLFAIGAKPQQVYGIAGRVRAVNDSRVYTPLKGTRPVMGVGGALTFVGHASAAVE